MPTYTPEQARSKLVELIERYRTLPHPELQSEANVRANFIDPLFEALNWPINDSAYYYREKYVRGTGFADIALQPDPTANIPLIYVEAKKFGVIESLARVQDRRNQNVAQLHLSLPGMSVDRTREEQQAINYAYQEGMRWAILTNFERFRLFNARRDTLVLDFDSPTELLERFDELWQLALTEVVQGSLEGLRAHRERLDVDEEYLGLINIWRIRLGQDIVSHRENRILLENPQTGEIDIYKLRDAVQRILDRLVIIRYAEDRLVIKADQLRTLVELRDRNEYSFPLLDQIRQFFQQFNVRHNGTLFAEHLCDRLTVSEEVLKAIIINLYDARFRAMSADIMGNTYEQYLGQTLALKQGRVEAVDNLETRKAQGSYYTPEYIVHYIVDQTVGRYLYGTDNGRPDGNLLPGERKKRLEEIDGSNGTPPLTVLDPACGSGSFLIYAYHVLEDFYQAEIKRITNERDRRFAELSAAGAPSFDDQLIYKKKLDALHGYQNQILERHLYGVDLDPQAAELAAVNLMLRAMTRGMRLPLILNQNIKIGNSLLGQVEPSDNAHAPQLAELRRIRLEQQGASQRENHPITLQGQFERLAKQVNAELNSSLTAYFGDDVERKRPFHWFVEFPERFVDADGHYYEEGGFTFVIGNPPYFSVDDNWGAHSPDAAYLQNAFKEIWDRKSDIYYYFIRQSLLLSSTNGYIGFITSRYYLEAYYAKKIHQLILQEATIKQIIDFGDYVVFPKVGIKACVTLLQQEQDKRFREQNEFVFDKVPNKQIDIRQFLIRFQKSAHPVSQSNLDSGSWNLYGQNISRILNDIDKDTQPLGRLAFVDTGMETGKNDVFVVSKETLDSYQIEPTLVRKNIKTQDIGRYNLAFRGLYLIYTGNIENLEDFPHAKAYFEEHRTALESRAAIARSDRDWWRFTWPRDKERYREPKIVTPNIAPENRFAFDSSAEHIGLTDTYAIFPTGKSPDLRYLLALLNSKLLNFRFRYIGKAKDYRYEYFKNGIKKIPIALANDETQQVLIDLAQRMLDLNFTRQLVYDEFREMLQATTHTTRDFYGAYYNHSEYRGEAIYRVGPADASTKGTVTKIHILEGSDDLQFRITAEELGDLPLITLAVPDRDLRHFLFLALRTELLANERKKTWSKGRLLDGVLKAVNVPVLDEVTAVANLAQIHAFMQELQQYVTRTISASLPSFITSLPDLLDLGVIEAELQEIDREIDRLVFQLYGIQSREDIRLIEETLG